VTVFAASSALTWRKVLPLSCSRMAARTRLRSGPGARRRRPIPEPLRPYFDAAMKLSPSKWVFPALDGSQRAPDANVKAVLRSALGRAGIVDGYEHRCRQPGCGHVELGSDDGNRRCPEDNRALWIRPLPKGIVFHSLRHTTATLLARAKVHPSVAQKILRHANIETRRKGGVPRPQAARTVAPGAHARRRSRQGAVADVQGEGRHGERARRGGAIRSEPVHTILLHCSFPRLASSTAAFGTRASSAARTSAVSPWPHAPGVPCPATSDARAAPSLGSASRLLLLLLVFVHPLRSCSAYPLLLLSLTDH
jgi:hypothetical protein